jgi:hypothetical protein
MLPIGLEYAETASNLVEEMDKGGGGSNRFTGVDFFRESFNTMPEKQRVWYAILYCAWHQLDGERLGAFRSVTSNDLRAIELRARRLTRNDWASIGRLLGVDGSKARERVYGVFGL